ncbi:MAG: hypothetical protein IPJ34_24250 [Myxococcales bacterium]|nr:hypothetical protein [Myxococcales bacterium]
MSYVVVGLVAATLVLLLSYVRSAPARAEADLREIIDAWVDAQGGSITWDAQGGAHVRGSRGEGHETFTALRAMCQGKAREELPALVGFALRKYLPDQFDEAFERSAQARLEKELSTLAALPVEALRARLRVKICSKTTSATGLATCSSPIVDGLEARVFLADSELDGLPKEVRAKLDESDAAVFATALDQTLGALPTQESAETHVWLCRPARLFGAEPHVIAAEGRGLAWAKARAEKAEGMLARLASLSRTDGALKGYLFGWDGEVLHRIGVTAHTIIGPDTPDYTLDVPSSLRGPLGLAAEGDVGVRR